jgi:NAD(P)-dependent dehydrogenase (short-subunit alcohol dehydrogenase family)
MSNKKVWYVTGASKGLGLALVKKLLAEGYRVAATSRTLASLTEAVGSGKTTDFLPLQVDLSSEQSVADSMNATHAAFGRIDVEVAQSFDVNVFATIRVIQQAMPYLRAQRSGHIINIASIAGLAGAVGWAVYAASKSAVIALSDIMAQDVKSLGIHVTAVAPGAFRTQFLSQESLVLAETKIDDYKEVRASHDRYLLMDGKQAGDPDKAAEAMISIAESPAPPVLLFLGEDAYNRAGAKIEQMTGQLEAWKQLSFSTQI